MFKAESRVGGSREKEGSRLMAEGGVGGVAEEGGDTAALPPLVVPEPRNPRPEAKAAARARAGRGARLGRGKSDGVGLGSDRTRLTWDPGPAGSEPAAPPSNRASPPPRSLPGFRRHLGDPAHFRPCREAGPLGGAFGRGGA